MKKLLLIAVVAFIAMPALAQEQGDIRASAGIAFGSKSKIDDSGSGFGMGINIGGEYLVSDQISVAPSYTFFFKSEQNDGFGSTASNQFSSFNLDGRYYFGDGDMQLYALAGLSFASNKIEQTGGGFAISGKSSKTGLNLGAGLMYPMGDALFLNGQVKYNTPFEQLEIQAGVAFGF